MTSYLGLRTKATLGILGIVILLGIAVIIVAKPAFYQKLFMTHQKRGISIARNIASNSVNPILTEKYFELEMMFRDYKSSEDDIAYIFILDDHGKVLAHTFENGFPSELINVNKVVSAQNYSAHRISTEKGEIIDIAVPLMNGELGSAHLGISDRQIKEDVNSIIKLIIWLVIAVLAAVAVMENILSRIITRPILELTKVAEDVGKGSLDRRVVVSSHDEIGQLGRTFNDMIDSRRQAEAALKESEQKFRSLAERSLVGIYLIQDDIFKYANPRFAEIFGFPVEEIIGKKRPRDLVFPEDVSLVEGKILKRTNGDADAVHYEFRGIKKNKEIINVEIFGSRISYCGGPAVIGTLLDITARKQMEEELSNHREQLEGLVVKRTEEMLRATHLASIGELAAGVAHEINNPINGIINYSQLLSNKFVDDSQGKDLAGRIIKEGNRVASIVHSLLSFGRTGKDEKMPVRIDEILSEALTLTAAQMSKEGIDLKIDDLRHLPEVLAHPRQLQQVFLNVLSNARYALNQKYPGSDNDKMIDIHGEKVIVNNLQFMRISFLDHGTGIPTHMIDKITNPFFTTKPTGHGTGLGLSISHEIIKAHGGALLIESEEHKFTRVIIELPAKGPDGR